jgi:hypothetical protein
VFAEPVDERMVPLAPGVSQLATVPLPPTTILPPGIAVSPVPPLATVTGVLSDNVTVPVVPPPVRPVPAVTPVIVPPVGSVTHCVL